MNGLAASMPWDTISSVGAVPPSNLMRFQDFSGASASIIAIATSSPTTRPATTMSNVARSRSEYRGNATHWLSMSAMRTPATGPENGRPDSCVEMDAALMASVS
jgi:hypothetical protein